jgi:surface antigen
VVQSRLLPAVIVTLALSACAGPRANYGTPTHLTCVPYARSVSGIDLSGDAWEWWGEAAGRYRRAHAPQIGAVLVFAPHGSMTSGHLAVVTSLVDARRIDVTQSNWLPYRIEHDQPVIDVSAANDWSEVRVWYEPVQAMGRTVYPTYGFILP